MKKMIALLCAALLLAVSCALADGNTVVEFRDALRLNGSLPDGYSYTLINSDDSSLLGQIASADPDAPVLAVSVAFNDNDSYIRAESLKDLSEEELGLIRDSFGDSNVTFDTLTTASGDVLMVVRENGAQFLDFYAVCRGYEIDLTLFPAGGTVLTEEQIGKCLEFIKTLDIVPGHE